MSIHQSTEGFMTLRRFNNIFSIIIVVFAAYILAAPFLGGISFWWQKMTNKTGGYVYETNLKVADDSQNLKAIPQDNRLVIPGMLLDQGIFEGAYAGTLDKGLWHRPGTSTPDKGGNTVIAGHRFAYGANTPFYHLDKLRQGDKFSVYWEGKEYNYQVRNILTVDPNALNIENNTTEPMITLYTCTPLWTSNKRLVIQAVQIKDQV